MLNEVLRARALIVGLALGTLAGCQTYHTLEPGPGSESNQYSKLLLVLRAGDQLEIENAVIRSDSIIGTSTPPLAAHRVAFARDDVVRIESQRRDAEPVAKAGGNWLMDVAGGVLKLLGCVFTLGRYCRA